MDNENARDILVSAFMSHMTDKIAKSLNEDERDTKAIVGVGASAVGAKSLGTAKHEALGTIKRYHTTSGEAAKSIKQQGLKTSFGGGKSGEAGTMAAEMLSPENPDIWRKRSKGKVYTTGNKSLGWAIKAQHFMGGDPMKAPDGTRAKTIETLGINADYMDFQKSEVDRNMIKGVFKNTESMGQTMGLDKQQIRQIKKDQLKEIASKQPSAAHTKDIPIEDIQGSAATMGQRVKRRMSRLPEYIKKHPGRFSKGVARGAVGAGLTYYGGKSLYEAYTGKTAQKKDMPGFLEQDRPEGVKKVYRALKRDHPEMSAEMKARIAARQGKPGKQKQGPPYKGPISG